MTACCETPTLPLLLLFYLAPDEVLACGRYTSYIGCSRFAYCQYDGDAGKCLPCPTGSCATIAYTTEPPTTTVNSTDAQRSVSLSTSDSDTPIPSSSAAASSSSTHATTASPSTTPSDTTAAPADGGQETKASSKAAHGRAAAIAVPVVLVAFAVVGGVYWRSQRGVGPFDARKPFRSSAGDGMEEVMMEE